MHAALRLSSLLVLLYAHGSLIPAFADDRCDRLVAVPGLSSPLETIQGVPRVRCVRAEEAVGMEVASANTALELRNYTLDAEQTQVSATYHRPLYGAAVVSFALPLRTRGGGVFDSAISEWHDAFGLPNGDRKDLEDREYLVAGESRDGDVFSLEKHPFTLANAVLGISGAPLPALELPWVASMTLPTALDESGHRGVNLHFDARKEAPRGQWALIAGGGGSLIGDTEFENVDYHRFLWRVSAGARYRFLDNFSVSALLQGERTAAEHIEEYPGHMVWLDVSLTVSTRELGDFSLSLQEDMTGQDAQADLVTRIAWLASL